MSGQQPPIDDRLHEAARSILDSPAWQVFGAHYRSAALLDVALAAEARDPIGVDHACVRIHAMSLIADALAAIVVDAKMQATAADRQRRRAKAEQRGARP